MKTTASILAALAALFFLFATDLIPSAPMLKNPALVHPIFWGATALALLLAAAAYSSRERTRVSSSHRAKTPMHVVDSR